MIYDTLTSLIWFYDGSNWNAIQADNLGDHTATTTLDMDNNAIQNVPSPSNNNDAANKQYVDQHEDNDADATNELQTLSASPFGDTLFLSDGNFLIVPGISDANYIKDFDGNVYTEVAIGDQIWLKENLSTTHYNDGTPIPKIEDNTVWDNWEDSWDGSMYTDTFDAYCWYDNDSTTYSKFGALYNWGVVNPTINGNKNACPDGYEVPTMAQLLTLIANAGGNISGLNLKLPPGEFWNMSANFPFGGNGTNSSGFSATGAGERRDYDGVFSNNKIHNYLWASTGALDDTVNAIRLRYDDWETNTYANRSGGEGYSIRCIKSE